MAQATLGQRIDRFSERSAAWPQWKVWAFALTVLAAALVVLLLIVGGAVDLVRNY